MISQMKPRRGCNLFELLIFLAQVIFCLSLSVVLYLRALEQSRSRLFAAVAVAGLWVGVIATLMLLAWGWKLVARLRKEPVDIYDGPGCFYLIVVVLIAAAVLSMNSSLRPLAQWLGLAGE
jgi:hypothetical protein